MAEPVASKVVNIQIAWGKEYELPLEDVVAGLKRILTEGVDELAPAKRITVMDQYWLIDGVRTTPLMLAAQQDEPIEVTVTKTVDDERAALPVDPREVRKPKPEGG